MMTLMQSFLYFKVSIKAYTTGVNGYTLPIVKYLIYYLISTGSTFNKITVSYTFFKGKFKRLFQNFQYMYTRCKEFSESCTMQPT